MKNKNALTVTCLLTLGGIALLSILDRLEKNTAAKPENADDSHDAGKSAAVTPDVPHEQDEPLTEIRSDAGQAIRDRHTEAASVIQESLNTIFEQTDNKDTDNNSILTQLDADLDELLKN